jgi:hypothetical protein
VYSVALILRSVRVAGKAKLRMFDAERNSVTQSPGLEQVPYAL